MIYRNSGNVFIWITTSSVKKGYYEKICVCTSIINKYRYSLSRTHEIHDIKYGPSF